MSRSGRPRDERGAVAVMVALLGVLIMSMAAISVDLGQGFVARADMQKSADLSALSAGNASDLPAPASVSSCAGGANNLSGPKASATDPAVLDVLNYLQGPPGYFTSTTAAALTDCSMDNGEVAYGRIKRQSNGSWTNTYNRMQISVYTPAHRVKFGFAKIMGVSGVTVQRQATASGGTPGGSALFPAYSVTGCDWGPQTIIDPANGQAVGYTPTLANAADSNIVTLDASTTPNPSPSTVPVGVTGQTVKITGNNRMVQATQVGFFQDGVTAGPTYVLPSTQFTGINNGNGLSFTLSNATIAGLTTANGLWYVRVWAPTTNNGSTFKWSAASQAVTFIVGSSAFRCSGASNSGNFGALKLPRTDSNDSTSNGWLPRNIIAGLQDPLALHTFPGAPTAYGMPSTAPSLCTSMPAGTIYSPTSGSVVLKPDTNCMDTDTGLAANAVTQGLVSGVSGVSTPHDVSGNACAPSCGVLVVNPSNAALNPCRSARSISVSSGSYTINDDVLTCYLTSNVTLGTISSPTYSGGAVLSCDIYNSPRFFYQPILQTQPSNGGSEKYSIVDFRPAFLTAQSTSASVGAGPSNSSNGVTVSNNSIIQLDVVFFNNNALNTECSNVKYSSPLGGTTKVKYGLIN